MNNSTLIASKNSTTGFTAYIDESTGQAFLTDTLICSLTGIHNQTLEKIIQSSGVHNFASEYALSLDGQGTRGVHNLRQASDFKTILLAWKPTKKENKERKEAILNSLIDAGITAYVYGLCGYTMKPVEQPIRKLPQRDTIEYVEAQEKIEKINNATLKELLRDQLIDELSILRGKTLLQAKPTDYTIVKVRARELGYSTQDIGNGSALGKFVAKQINPAFVERVGKYGVKHYEVNDQLDTTIKTYFGLKRAIA